MIALKYLPGFEINVEIPSFEEIRPRVEQYLPIAAAVVVVLVLLSAGIRGIVGHFSPPAGVVGVTVHQGDTLWKYAEKYGNPNTYILKRVQRIAHMNGISTGQPLQPGQQIVVPMERIVVTASAGQASNSAH